MYRPFAGLVAVTLVFAVAAAAPIPKDRQMAPYFPAQKGFRWVFENTNGSEYTEVITDVESRDGAKVISIGMETPQGQVVPTHVMKVTQDGLTCLMTGTNQYDPPRKLLRLPIRSGDRWVTDTAFGADAWKGTRTLKDVERVKVPAGTFMAARVEAEEGTNPNPAKVTSWYVPTIGRIKYVNAATNTGAVLKSFTPGDE